MSDGFAYNTGLRPNPLDFHQLAIGVMDDIRNASMFEHVTLVSPPSNVIIPALGTYIEQLRPRQGSVIYGVLAQALPDYDIPFTFKLWPSKCPGTILSRGSYTRNTFTNGSGNGQGANNLRYTILTEPYVCAVHEAITVQISNPSSTNSLRAQVLLLVAQPLPALQSVSGRFCK